MKKNIVTFLMWALVTGLSILFVQIWDGDRDSFMYVRNAETRI